MGKINKKLLGQFGKAVEEFKDPSLHTYRTEKFLTDIIEIIRDFGPASTEFEERISDTDFVLEDDLLTRWKSSRHIANNRNQVTVYISKNPALAGGNFRSSIGLLLISGKTVTFGVPFKFLPHLNATMTGKHFKFSLPEGRLRLRRNEQGQVGFQIGIFVELYFSCTLPSCYSPMESSTAKPQEYCGHIQNAFKVGDISAERAVHQAVTKIFDYDTDLSGFVFEMSAITARPTFEGIIDCFVPFERLSDLSKEIVDSIQYRIGKKPAASF
jgi:hypothetical protein